MKNEKFLLDIQTKCGDIANEILKTASDAERIFKSNRPSLHKSFGSINILRIDKKSLCNNILASQGVNHVGQLFNENGMTKA